MALILCDCTDLHLVMHDADLVITAFLVRGVPFDSKGGPGFFLEQNKNFESYKNKTLACKEKKIHNHLKKLYSMSKFTHFLSILLARLVIL